MIAKFDGTTWTNYLKPNTITSGGINTIAIDAQGNEWFGTESGGALKFDGTNWTSYNITNSGILSNTVNAITIDAQGNKWFGTDKGVSKLKD